MIRALLPMAADGVGPSHTCVQLVNGMAQAGSEIEILVNRMRGEHSKARVISALPGPLAFLPYQFVSSSATRSLERRFLQDIGHSSEPEIAWLWPSVSLATHEAVAAAGVPIVLEGINTRMARAKLVLDAAYDEFGAVAGHGITEERVLEEEAKLALAATIFAPSPGVENALDGSPMAGRFIASSYGTDCQSLLAPRVAGTSSPDATVTFLFVGYACVRKGIHHLLDIWPRLPRHMRLQIVGRIEPVILERYANLLGSDRIDVLGFKREVSSYYAAADAFVFPSLEEGDPLVVYEAALHGLPILASNPGAGRIGAEKNCIKLIDPAASDHLEEALIEFGSNEELRRELGERARTAVQSFDWRRVGADRAKDLAKLLHKPSATSVRPDTYSVNIDGKVSETSSQTLISVVMPTFNRSSSVLTAINSVLRQSWDNLELIVVDDCSTDDTVKVVSEIDDPRVRLISRDRNAGPSAARNQGIAASKGKWVAFQDSDDEWLPEKLALQMARIEESEFNCIAAYCGMVVEGRSQASGGERAKIRYVPPSNIKVTEGDLVETLFATSMVSTQMLVARRDVLLSVGLFDESLQALEDWDLSIRLAERGEFAFVDRILVIQRLSSNSITFDRRKWAAARASMIAKHVGRLKDNPAVLSHQYRVLAGEYRREGMLEEAGQAIDAARRLRPMSVGLWLRTLHMTMLRLIQQI